MIEGKELGLERRLETGPFFPRDVEMMDGGKEMCICVYGCHSDDIGFVSLWCLL